MKSALLGQHCQLGLVEGPFDENAFDALPLGRDEIIAVAGAKHPYARRRKFGAAELADTGLVMREEGSGSREVVAQAYAAHGTTLEPKLTIGSPKAIKRLLRIGRAVSWVSRVSVADELEDGTLGTGYYGRAGRQGTQSALAQGSKFEPGCPGLQGAGEGAASGQWHGWIG